MAKIMCRQVAKIMCRLTFTITGNTVVIEIQGYVDTSSEAQWSVTAVGK